jgi:hypothetical protein
MAIPALDPNGVLPAGVHDCTLEEIKSRFGSFQGSDRRPQLFSRLETFLTEARGVEIVQSVLVDGSFVTAKADPNDIDLLSSSRRGTISAPTCLPEYTASFPSAGCVGDTVLTCWWRGTAPRNTGDTCDSSNRFDLNPADQVMIETEVQLQQALEQIENLSVALQSLRADVFPKNPRNFAILAEGPVDEIRKLQAALDDYISRLEAAVT